MKKIRAEKSQILDFILKVENIQKRNEKFDQAHLLSHACFMLQKFET